MVSPDDRVALFLDHHGSLAIAAANAGTFGQAQIHDTPAGHWVDLGNPLPGLLVLVDGHAVLELHARNTSPATDILPDVTACLAGQPPERDLRLGRPDGRRVRLGVGEALMLRPVPFDAKAKANWPRLSVYALSPLKWAWQPENGAIDRDNPASPLAAVHDDFARYLSRGLQPQIAAFPGASALSFDAARLVASFGAVKRLVEGRVLFEKGADTHAGVVVSGSVGIGRTVLRAGDLLFPHRFGPGPFSFEPAPEDVVAREDTLVVLFHHEMLVRLAQLDQRGRLAAPTVRTRALHVVIGDADEARPDGQTMAIQVAASIAQEIAGFPEIPGEVWYVDLDGERFSQRLPVALRSVVPLVESLVGLPVLPTAAPWRKRGLLLELAAVSAKAVTSRSEVEQLLKLLLPDSPGTVSQVILRVPRAACSVLEAVFEQAYSVSISCDHLVERVPDGLPATCDLVRLRRFGRRESTILVEEMPETRYERADSPTTTFWSTGIPWCLA